MSLRQEIADFLGRKRIAVVGVSTEPAGFSRVLFRELAARGYDVIPVTRKRRKSKGGAPSRRFAISIRGPKRSSS